MSEEGYKQRLDVIKSMMQNHKHLYPKIFDENKHMLPEIRQHMLGFADFIRERALLFFPHVEIDDIVLRSSVCSYVYNEKSDIDLMLILNDDIDENLLPSWDILNAVNNSIVASAYRPMMWEHALDYGVLYKSNPKCNPFNSYSLLCDKWRREPQYQEFAFTAEELYEAYKGYSRKLHEFVAGLEKINDAFLSLESCKRLREYLKKLRVAAYDAEENSDEHEYSLEYNLYRLLKKFGAWQHFNDYVDVSYKNHIRRKV